MKAISIRQPYANWIAEGKKTIETRTWSTKHRGPLLIVSSLNPNIPPAGCALAIVRLVHCRPMVKEDEEAACCDLYSRAWAWELENIRPIKPFHVKGQLGLYEVILPINLNKIRRRPLMAQNYISHGEVITLTAKLTHVSGKPCRVSGFNGVSLVSVEPDGQLSLQLEGIFEFPLSGVKVGDPIYIDGPGNLTLSPTLNVLFGRAVSTSDAKGKFYCRLLQSA